MKYSRWLETENLFFIFAFIFLSAIAAIAGPSRTTYQAKIIKPDGYPLETMSVNFKFTVLDPTGSCILYSETYSSVNMANTGGLISFALGSGVKVYPVSATTFENVFSNITPNLSCDAGGPPSYSPASSDVRKLVMQFHDGNGWQTLPAMSINAVPYAMYANNAEKLNGKTDTDFVQVSTLPMTCGVSEALRFNGAAFSCIAVGGGGTAVTSGSVITALGYTPADGASVTTLSASLSSTNSDVSAVSSTVFSVSSTVAGLSASMAAITSSQWTSNASDIFYASGRVGIGTSSPVAMLHVSDNVVLGSIPNYTNGGSGLYLSNEAGDANNFFRIDGYADDLAIVASSLSGASQGTTISFKTAAAGGGINAVTRMRIAANGFVGIGVTTPVTKLDVAGGIRIGTEAATCAAGFAGTLRYNAGVVEYCNGTSWAAFGVSGAGILAINGLASGSQTFAFGATGNSPNVSSVGSVHTFNFPFASEGTTTAGMISNTDYLNFSNKITSSAASIAQVLGYTPASASALANYLIKTNNLSDLASSASARTNLGLGNAALLNVGTSAGTVAAGNDSRMVNALQTTTNFSGDVSGTYNTLNLVNSGVSAGIYTSVTVDTKGRVTSGSSSLAASNITGVLPLANGGTGSSTSAGARTNLGLGSIATYNQGNSVGTVPTLGVGGLTSGSICISPDGNTISCNTSVSSLSQWTTSGASIFYNTGNVGIGTSSPVYKLDIDVMNADLRVKNSGSSGYPVQFMDSYSDFASWAGAALIMRRARGTEAAPTYVNSGDSLGYIAFRDHLGGGGALIGTMATEAHSATAKGTSLIFQTNANGVVAATEKMRIDGSGNVGIGTSTPVTKLVVSGGVKISMESATCAVSYAGTLRYNSGNVEFCNGTTWTAFGVSGAGLQSFNGSTSGTQTFANGTTGTAPAFVTANGVHTLNIPLASAGSVTAGLLSNADYTTFSNKIASSAASIAQVLGYVPASATALGNYLVKANNLSDLASSATARTNLGLGGFATVSSLDLGSASATGTLALARLPAFTGDATIAAASNTIILSNSGVTAATYTKVTVDVKGRVTSGSNLSSGDVTTALGYTPASASASTQWNTSGTTINYVAGNVGIGTTSPTMTLDIQGGSSVNGSNGIRVLSTNASGNNNALIEAIAKRSDGNVYGTFAGTLALAKNRTDAAMSTSGSALGRIMFGANHTDGSLANLLYSTSIQGVAEGAFSDENTMPSGLAFYTGSTGYTTSQTTSHIGSERLRISSSGNIGIGTTLPTRKLQIGSGNGSLKFDTFTAGSSFTPLMSGSDFGSYIEGGDNAQLVVALRDNDNNDGFRIISGGGNYMSDLNYDTAVFTAQANGNVGIGTTTPTAKLHLAAGTTSTAPFKFTSGTLLTSPQSGTMEYDGSGFYLTDGAGTRRVIATATNPGSLDNASIINSTGNMNLVPVGSVIVSSTTVSTNSQTGALIVKGGLGVAGSIFATEITATSATITPYVYGSTASGGSLRLESTTNANKGNVFLASGGGNVGVGNLANPTSPLHVMGSSNNASTPWMTIEGGGSTLDNIALRLFDRGTGAANNNILEFAHGVAAASAVATSRIRSVGVGTNSVSGSSLFLETASDNLGTWNSDQLVLNRNGNIGVGTDDAQAKFHIVRSVGTTIGGSSSNTANAGLIIEGGASGVMAIDGNEIQQFGDNLFLRGENGINFSTGDFADSDSSTPMVLLRNGRLGVGTTNPLVQNHFYKPITLGAVGSLNLNNAVVRISEAASTTLNFDGNTMVAEDDLFIGTKGVGTFQLFSSDTVRVNILNTGHVGIGGNFTPTARLHLVSGTTSANSAPLKFTSGTLMTTAQAGAVEYNGFDLYFTDGAGVRRALAMGSTPSTIDDASFINASGNITMTPVGSVVVSSTTPATNTSTGALIVKGGLGVAGNIFATEITATSATITPYIYGSIVSGGSLSLESTMHANKGNITLNTLGGNVGIGTASPLDNLHVHSATGDATLRLSADPLNNNEQSVPGILMQGDGALTNLFIGMTALTPQYTGVPENSMVLAATTGAPSSGSGLYFVTGTNVSNTVKLAINEAGNIGIGTTAPVGVLHVTHNTGPDIRLENTNAVSSALRLLSQNGATYFQSGVSFGAGSTADIRFTNMMATSTWMTIQASTGNVGIGTASPGSKLDVVGNEVRFLASTDAEGVKLHSAYSNNETSSRLLLAERQDNAYGWSLVDAATANPSLGGTTMSGLGAGTFNIVRHDATATGVAALSIDRVTGNVGINNSAPAMLMDLYGAVSPTLRIRSASNDPASGPTIRLVEDLAENGAVIRYHTLTNSLDLGVVESGVENMPLSIFRLNGRIGLGGVTSATAKVHLGVGTTSIAPLKFTSGVLMSATQAGAMEYDGVDFYITDGNNIRRTIATATTAGTLDNVSVVSSPSGIALWPAAGNSVTVSATTASTNSTTGALIVKGGLGVAGNIYSSGTIITSSNIQGASITATSGMITPYVYGSIVSGGSLRLEATTHATKGSVLLASGGGNVGIRTASPSGNLDIGGAEAADEKRLAFSASDNSDRFYIETDLEGSTNSDRLGFRSVTTDNILLMTGAGNVGLGTASPQVMLTVDDSNGTVSAPYAATTDKLAVIGTGNAIIQVTTPNNQTGGIYFSDPESRDPGGVAYSHLSDSMIFRANAATRMTITASGNVGIGTTAPVAILHSKNAALVGGNPATTGTTDTAILQRIEANTGVLDIGMQSSGAVWLQPRDRTNLASNFNLLLNSNGGNVGVGTTVPTYNLHVQNRPGAGGNIAITNSDYVAGSVGSGIYMGTQTATGNTYSQIQAFTTGNTVAGILAVNPFGGNVGIATTAPSEKLHIVGNLRVQGSTDCTLGNGAGGTNCSSDVRLKENIKPIPYALEKILSLRGVEFDWNSKSVSYGRHDIGVIAQEVEKVFPTAVINDKATGYKKVDYAVLVAPIIEALKEFNKRIAQLFDRTEKNTREIASVKEENAELKARVEKSEKENAELKKRLERIEKALLNTK